MAQILIYGHRKPLTEKRQALSDVIHRAMMSVLALPSDKRFHRFIPLDEENFIHPTDRSPLYTIIEISLFEGRTKETKKELIRTLFRECEAHLAIPPQDLEITLHESPRENWGIRGKPGDELVLNYKIET